MAPERTQHSTVHRVFLREELPCHVSIHAKLFLRFEDGDVLSGSFDKVDEIDMFPNDGLGEYKGLS
jgi:hypothetical protein